MKAALCEELPLQAGVIALALREAAAAS